LALDDCHHILRAVTRRRFPTEDSHQLYGAADCVGIADSNINGALHAGCGMLNLRKAACNGSAVLCESVRASGRYSQNTQAKLEGRYGFVLSAGSYQYVTGSR
jgi:hypothetical protein